MDYYLFRCCCIIIFDSLTNPVLWDRLHAGDIDCACAVLFIVNIFYCRFRFRVVRHHDEENSNSFREGYPADSPHTFFCRIRSVQRKMTLDSSEVSLPNSIKCASQLASISGASAQSIPRVQAARLRAVGFRRGAFR
jgi:hypothetical protein